LISNRQATSSGSTVDQAIQQQGGGQWRGAELVGEGGQQDRFEDPDTTRYMAEHASGQGQQVHQQEGAERRGFRQQQIQHGGGGGDVQRGDDQLQEGQAPARQAQCAATDPDQQVVAVGLFRQAAAIDADGQNRQPSTTAAIVPSRPSTNPVQWRRPQVAQVASAASGGRRSPATGWRTRHVRDFRRPQTMSCI
jgi:hypothetical protein